MDAYLIVVWYDEDIYQVVTKSKPSQETLNKMKSLVEKDMKGKKVEITVTPTQVLSSNELLELGFKSFTMI